VGLISPRVRFDVLSFLSHGGREARMSHFFYLSSVGIVGMSIVAVGAYAATALIEGRTLLGVMWAVIAVLMSAAFVTIVEATL